MCKAVHMCTSVCTGEVSSTVSPHLSITSSTDCCLSHVIIWQSDPFCKLGPLKFLGSVSSASPSQLGLTDQILSLLRTLAASDSSAPRDSVTPWSEHVSDMRMQLLRMGLDLGVPWARERTAAYFMAKIPHCQQHPVKMVNSFSNRSYKTGRLKG